MSPPPLSCVVWMDDHLLLGGDSGDLHVWEADTLREINRHKAHSGLTNSLSLSLSLMYMQSSTQYYQAHSVNPCIMYNNNIMWP